VWQGVFISSGTTHPGSVKRIPRDKPGSSWLIEPMNLNDARLYGILDLGYVAEHALVAAAQAMAAGGVDIVQLRAKNCVPAEIARLAQRVRPVFQETGIPLILNDHPALVPEAGADGVHVGQDDTPVAEARLLAGEGRIVGKSTHSIEQAVAAAEEGPDYIAFGPLFQTPTKPDYTPTGLADLAEVHRRVSLPVFCIGGIKKENLREVIEAGARRVVVVSGILQASDMVQYCRELKEMLPPLR
jgi:thiamine-phosphate pyrophosphorylase